jgi:hypothetical protein
MTKNSITLQGRKGKEGMTAVKAKAVALTPKANDVEVEAKVKALDQHLAKEEGRPRRQRQLQPPRPSP